MDLKLRLPIRGGGAEDKGPQVNKEGAQLTSSLHGGRWYEAAREGRVFSGTAAAAGYVIPIFSNTAQKFGIWNPKGSGINVVPISLTFGYVSTTGAAGGFVLGVVQNAPAQLATGATITAFTEGTLNTDIFNGLVGKAIGPTAKFTPSAATVTAPVILRQLGLNQLVITAADATNTQWLARCDFDGDLIIPPGNAVFVAGNIATLITMTNTLVWAEEPA